MQITLSQGFGMSGAARSCVLGIEGYSLNRGEAPSRPAAPCLPLLLGWSQPPLHLVAEKELSSPSPPPHRSPRDHSHWEALSLIVIPTNLAAANKSHPPPLPTCLHANPFVGYLNNSGAVISPPLWQPAGREGRRMMTVGNSVRLLEAAQTCFVSPFPSPAQRRAGRRAGGRAGNHMAV